jgi:hypothetical protein
MCDMKTDYSVNVPMASQGSRLLRWQWYADGRCLPGSYGCAECFGDTCTVLLNGSPPKWDDVCGLAKLGHEISHYMKADHD